MKNFDNENGDYNMKCPFCHEEMKPGYVQSTRQIMWEKIKDMIFMPDDKKDEFYISEGVWSGFFAEVEYCNKCKTISSARLKNASFFIVVS